MKYNTLSFTEHHSADTDTAAISLMKMLHLPYFSACSVTLALNNSRSEGFVVLFFRKGLIS